MIRNYLASAAAEAFSDGDSFLEKGILDSIGVIELVAFIQSEFDVRIKVQEIIPEHFDSIDNIVRYLTGKMSAPIPTDRQSGESK